jgi:hypothetical protein
MAFKHPLARDTKVWTATAYDGRDSQILAVVTTLELNPNHKNYRKSLVERLSAAAKEYLAKSSEATSFVLMNRPKDWS